MREQSDTIPAGEFESWFTPPQALAALREGISDYGRRAVALTERAAADLLVVAAETYRRTEDGTSVNRGHWVIPAKIWEHCAPSTYDDFWETGQFHITERRSHGGDIKVSYFGVRFDPVGVRSLMTASGIPPAEPTADQAADVPEESDRRKLPRLPEEHLRKWHALFIAAHPDGTVTLAQRSVEGMFPNHHIARDRIRELFPDARRGRPKKNNDVGNSRKSDGE